MGGGEVLRTPRNSARAFRVRFRKRRGFLAVVLFSQQPPKSFMNTYRATNTLNGKFYIGSTKDFEYRKYQHLRSKETYPFQTDLRKNPEAFVWEVYVDDLDTNEHEVRLLREFFFDVRCYNLNSCAERPPSQKGRTWWKNELTQKQKRCFEKPEGAGWEKGMLQETIKKVSVANTGKTRTEAQKQARSGEKNWNYGVRHTEAQNKAKSERMSGENNPMYGRTGALHHNSKGIIVIEPEGTEEHFVSGCEAASKLEIDRGLLSYFLRNGNVLKNGRFKGWRFAYGNQ